MTRKVSLMVNDAPISLDYFVEDFIDHITGGMIASLDGTGEIKTLELTVDGDKVAVNLNDAEVPVNAFVAKIFRATVEAMVSTLKGVSAVNRVKINITR